MSSVGAMAAQRGRRPPVMTVAVLMVGLALVAGIVALGVERAMAVMRLLHGGVDYHEDATHSFFLDGHQSVQCARNTGIYIGAFLTMPWAWVTGRGRAVGFPPLRLAIVLALFFGVMVADGINSLVAELGYVAAYRPNTGLRLGTGLLAGTAAGMYFLPVLNGLLWRQPDERPVLGGALWLVALLAIEFALWLVVILGVDWFSVPIAVLTSSATLTLFGSVNLLVLVLLLRADNRYGSVGDLARPAVIALCVALVQLGLLGVLVRAAIAV